VIAEWEKTADFSDEAQFPASSFEPLSTPNNGIGKAVVRRIRIADQVGESHMLLNMAEDMTDQADFAGVASFLVF
jgi:hypothetical protein